MTKHDRAALKQCMEIAQRDPGRATQLRSKLEDELWQRVAEFAAFCCQSELLNLEPWQLPPCNANEDHDDPAQPDAVKLLRRMLAAGVSRYEPDPLAALRRSKSKTIRKRPKAAT